MTFKEFKKMYDENKNIKYIKIIVKDVEKIFYARISEIEVEYERYNEKTHEWEDSEPYWEITFIDTIGTLYGISEDEIINIELSNKQEFEIGIYGENGTHIVPRNPKGE